MADKPTRDEVLKRLLKTPPTRRKPAEKPKKGEADPMPDDPDALVEWGKRNIQKD